MKNILLLTDFSENALNAIAYALQFFRGSEHRFFILNVQKASNYTTSDLMASTPQSSIYDSILKKPKALLKKMVQEFEKKFDREDYSFASTCDYDSFISAVNQSIKLNKIKLIVMGTNGTTDAKEVIFGSNTISVIRNVASPVLVIPQDYKYEALNSILLAIENNELFSETSLQLLLKIITNYKTKLQVLHIKKDKNDEIKEKERKINAFFKDVKPQFYTIEKVPADIAIDCFVQFNEIGLVAKTINKESFFKRLISGSTIDEITYKTRVPLLIMHP